MAAPFDQVSNADIVALIDAYPLAWVVSNGPDGYSATPLPCLAETDADGRVVRIVGHYARSNPQLPLLERNARALFLFQGPHGYVSPSWVSNRTWAPTWNYAVVKIEADVRLVPERIDSMLADMVGRMETGRPNAWSASEMGERYERLKRAVVAFEADVVTLRARYKLGQDERPEIYADILEHVQDEALAAWMRRMNPGRG